MSTFAVPEIALQPSLICAGRVASVSDARLGKSENYYVSDIELEAVDAGKNQRIYFCFRPEWMREMSSTELRRFKEEQKGPFFVYEKNIAANPDDEKFEPSTLQGLTGFLNKSSDATAFNELAGRLIALGTDAIEANPALVTDVLRQFLVEERGDFLVGYIRGQQMNKTGEKDENGRNVYTPGKYTEIKGFWNASDPKAIERQTKKSEKNPERYRMTFAGCAF